MNQHSLSVAAYQNWHCCQDGKQFILRRPVLKTVADKSNTFSTLVKGMAF